MSQARQRWAFSRQAARWGLRTALVRGQVPGVALLVGCLSTACNDPSDAGIGVVVESTTTAAGSGEAATAPGGGADASSVGTSATPLDVPMQLPCNGEAPTATGSCYAREVADLDVQSLAVGDFDGDGQLDLAAILEGDETGVQLLAGDGAGQFAPPISFTLLDDNKTYRDVHDFTWIGALPTTGPDRLFALSQQVWWSNMGAISLSKFAAPTWNSARVLFGDLDGDTDDDVTIMYNGFVFESLCDGVECEEPRPQYPQNLNAPESPRRASMLDFDEDGRADLVTVSSDGPVRIWWWRNEGNGVFADEPSEVGPFPHEGQSARSWAFGDVNGDGHADLVLSDLSSFMAPEQLRLWLSVADGASEDSPYLDNVGETGGLVIVDLDGDGTDELLQLRADKIRIWGFESGTIAPVGDIGFGGAKSAGNFATGDFDDDGQLDFVQSVVREDLSRAIMLVRTGA